MKNSTSLVIGKKRRGEEEVTWQAPEEGWCKMNVEGSSINASGTQIMACGGLLRNHQGTFLQGFMIKTYESCSDNNDDNDGPSTSRNNNNNNNNGMIQAQLWSCLLGLKIAWDFGIRKLVVETTDPTVVQIAMRLRRPAAGNLEGSLRMMEMEIGQLLGRSWVVRVLVVKRESNVAAYNLAEAAIWCMPGFHMLHHSLPHHVHEVVLQEAPTKTGNIKKIK